jgi:hypothetical protein
MTDAVIRNVLYVSFVTLCESIQVVMIAAIILNSSPIVLGDFLNSILPFFRDMVRPEREMPLFALFIAANGLIYALRLWFARKEIHTAELSLELRRLALLQAGFVLIQAAACFFMFTAGNPIGARVVLYAAIILSAGQHLGRVMHR